MELLQQIVNKIEENLPQIKVPGLFYGKMGMVIFFFHYARFSGDDNYEDIGLELIESIQQDIDYSTPATYGSGLAGIGTGLLYLARNKFLEGNISDILVDFDNIIWQDLIYNELLDASLENGLCGIGKYYTYRIISGETWGADLISINNRLSVVNLLDRLEALREEQVSSKEEILSLLIGLYKKDVFNVRVEMLMRYYLQDHVSDLCKLEQKIADRIKERGRNITSSQTEGIGLYRGLVGSGLVLMAKNNGKDQSWMDLII